MNLCRSLLCKQTLTQGMIPEAIKNKKGRTSVIYNATDKSSGGVHIFEKKLSQYF